MNDLFPRLLEFELDANTKFPDSPLSQIALQLSSCSECMQIFHINRRTFLRGHVLGSSGHLERWNAKRQAEILVCLLADYQKIGGISS